MDFYEGSLVYDCFDNEEDAHALIHERLDIKRYLLMSKYILTCEKDERPSERCCKKCHDRGDFTEFSLSINGERYEFRHCCNYGVSIDKRCGSVNISVDYL